MRNTIIRFPIIALLVTLVAACAADQPDLILSKKGAVELRAMQSRAFETGDRQKIYRAMISTFQDLGYTISKVEPAAGTITADKLAMLKMTASVYPRSEQRTIVRANAIVKLAPQIKQGHQVDAPEFYQKLFFEPLSKALFLTALEVEDSEIPAEAKVAEDGSVKSDSDSEAKSTK